MLCAKDAHACACSESVEHTYADCTYVAELWKLVLRRWNEATGQELDHQDARVTLLGDRSAGADRDAHSHMSCGSWYTQQ